MSNTGTSIVPQFATTGTSVSVVSTAFALPRDTPGAVTTVLSTLHAEHHVGRGILGFLSTREACALRLVNHECRDAVTAATWHDAETRITGSLASWRACFPGALAANVMGRSDLMDADFVHLTGVKTLDMRWCPQITDAGLAHLTGVKTLDIRRCERITDAGLAHLTGVETLDMSGCWGFTDAGLRHLRGVKTLVMSHWNEAPPYITDAGLAHLTGVKTLNISWCNRITDAGLAHLTGVETLIMIRCKQITDAGLVHLAGVKTLKIGGCNITDAGLAHLTGVKTLDICGSPARITDAGLAHLTSISVLHAFRYDSCIIAAARARGISVVEHS